MDELYYLESIDGNLSTLVDSYDSNYSDLKSIILTNYSGDLINYQSIHSDLINVLTFQVWILLSIWCWIFYELFHHFFRG